MSTFRVNQRLLGLALCMFSPVLTACGQAMLAPAQSVQVAATPSVQVVEEIPTSAIQVVGEANDLPPGCRPDELANVVLRFVDAYNAGDQVGLTALFDPWLEQLKGMDGSYADNFLGKGGAKQDHFDTANRDELLAYFAERYRQHDQFRLLAIDAIALQEGLGSMHNVDMMVRYLRQADDLPVASNGADRVVHGRAAIRCHDQKITIWVANSGVYQQDVEEWLRTLCDTPATRGRSSVLVCAEFRGPYLPKEAVSTQVAEP